MDDVGTASRCGTCQGPAGEFSRPALGDLSYDQRVDRWIDATVELLSRAHRVPDDLPAVVPPLRSPPAGLACPGPS